MPSALIAYYSFSQTTHGLAVEIARQTGADLRALVPEKPYSFAHVTAAQEVRTQIGRGHCPPLASGNEPTGGYDFIFIGSPNWYKTIAPPVLTFLRDHDFAGVTLAPFCTHGGGGLGDIPDAVARACPGAIITHPFAPTGDDNENLPKSVAAWLSEIAWADARGFTP